MPGVLDGHPWNAAARHLLQSRQDFVPNRGVGLGSDTSIEGNTLGVRLGTRDFFETPIKDRIVILRELLDTKTLNLLKMKKQTKFRIDV